MKMGENWHVNAPWAQLVCSTQIPEDKVVKFYAISNEVLDEAEATDDPYGNGVIPLPWVIPYDKFGKYGVTEYIMEMIQHYLDTILSNGNIHSHLNTIIPGGPHTQWHSRIVAAWVVSQKENDYIPVHTHHLNGAHEESCKISGILYLKVPEQMKVDNVDNNDIAIRGGRDGQILFTGMGGVDPFSTTMQYNIQPEVGWLYLFPSSLNHQVYPFKGEGERRGISFNIDVISQEQLDIMILQNEEEQNAAE
jgi:hypothetical protein